LVNCLGTVVLGRWVSCDHALGNGKGWSAESEDHGVSAIAELRFLLRQRPGGLYEGKDVVMKSLGHGGIAHRLRAKLGHKIAVDCER
jgi:hypothetical protein